MQYCSMSLQFKPYTLGARIVNLWCLKKVYFLSLSVFFLWINVPGFFYKISFSFVKWYSSVSLKALKTFGNCGRPVFSLGASHLWNLWKWAHRRCRRIMNEKTPLIITICMCFRCMNKASGLKYLWNTLVGNYLCFKCYYFRGSRFSQRFILSAAPHCSLPSKFLC